VTRAPEIAIDVDRTLAEELGLTQRDVASSLLVSLASSGQAAPNYWLNRQNGVNYQVAVQTPQYRIDSMDSLGNTPITAPALASDPTIIGPRSRCRNRGERTPRRALPPGPALRRRRASVNGGSLWRTRYSHGSSTARFGRTSVSRRPRRESAPSGPCARSPPPISSRR
jgi:hypothetical protein